MLPSAKVGYSRKRWREKFFYVKQPFLTKQMSGWIDWNPTREEWVHCEISEKASILFSTMRQLLPDYDMKVPETVTFLMKSDSFSFEKRSWIKHCVNAPEAKRRRVLNIADDFQCSTNQSKREPSVEGIMMLNP